MKKILRTALTLSLVWLGSCTDYGDDFDNLNQRIDALESQIAGFADLNSGVTALDGKVNALADVLATLPDNTDLGAGLANLQEQLEALQSAMAALDANDTDIQGQVDALNDALALLNDDMQELLNANNVYPGDLVIRTEGALDAVLEYVKDRETLIIDGALVIDPLGDASYDVDSDEYGFDAERVNKLTSKITAVLGRTFDFSYGEGDDLDSYGELVSGVVGSVVFAGEVQDVRGSLDLSSLKTINGFFHVDDIDGSVNMSALVRQTSLEMNHLLEESDYLDEDATINEDSRFELDDIYEDGLPYSGAIEFDDIEENIDISSLISAYALAFNDVEGSIGINAASLVTVDKDLGMSDIDGGFSAPLLKEVGGSFVLAHNGDYSYPELLSVGEIYGRYLDDEYPSNLRGDLIMEDNENSIINFPKLNYVYGEITVYSAIFRWYQADSYASVEDYDGMDWYDTATNTFSAATSVTIYGEFSNDLAEFLEPGECESAVRYDVRGFAAPNATSVTVNGDYDTWDEEYDIWGDLYVDAPGASVTLNGSYVDGSLGIRFASLTTSGLRYIEGDLILLGGRGKEEALPVNATLADLATVDDIHILGLDELKLTVFDTEANEAYIYGMVNKLELKNASTQAIKLSYLENLTITALNNTFNFDGIARECGLPTAPPPTIPLVVDGEPGIEQTLKTVSITGADCSASVILSGDGETNGTDFDAITSLSLGGTLADAIVVGADGLETLTTSGTITNWVDVDNTPTTRTIGHTPGDCSVE